MKKLLLISLLLWNCGQEGTDNKQVNSCKGLPKVCSNGKQDVSEGLRKTLAWVEFKLGKKVAYDVVFGNLEGQTAGVCYTINNKPLMIVVDKLSWANSDTDGKKQLMLHEVGHCSYGLGHTEVVGAVMYYSMILKGAKKRYKQAQKEFIKMYNTYGGVIPHN